MYTAKITNIEPIRHQAKNKDFLDVTFDIMEGDKVLETKRIGLDVGVDREQVQSEIQKYIVEYGREAQNKVEDIKKQEAEKNINDMKENLVGKVIEPVEGDEINKQ